MHDQKRSADISLTASDCDKIGATRWPTSHSYTVSIAKVGSRSTMTRVSSCALFERGLSAETVNERTSIEAWVATYHVIDTAEEPVAPFPFAHDLGVMLCLVARAVFLA